MLLLPVRIVKKPCKPQKFLSFFVYRHFTLYFDLSFISILKLTISLNLL